METEQLLAIFLPGLQGSLSFSLSDQQLGTLLEGLLEEKAAFIGSVKFREGYLVLSLKIPLIGEKSINLEIDSIKIRSDKLLVSLKILNVSRLLIKGVVAILGTKGIECELIGENLILYLSDKWNTVVSRLPQEAIEKLNCIEIGTALNSNKAEIIVKLTSTKA